ncbi:MAG: hypothetical protein SOH93_01795 [Oscillospiraceae bacterium]|jgi:hypothetical protein
MSATTVRSVLSIPKEYPLENYSAENILSAQLRIQPLIFLLYKMV